MKNPYPSIRVFKSPFLEFFSHVPPALPAIVWCPVVLAFAWKAWHRAELPLSSAVLLFCAGIFLWTLAEYLLHRFVFHFSPRGRFQERLQFIMHGMHHDDVNDPTRLVMSPVVALGLAFFFYGLFDVAFGVARAEPLFSGFVAGYLWYDYTHYYLHHFRPRTSLGRRLRQNHMKHHVSKAPLRWGVSTPLWDHVFGTYDERPSPTTKTRPRETTASCG